MDANPIRSDKPPRFSLSLPDGPITYSLKRKLKATPFRSVSTANLKTKTSILHEPKVQQNVGTRMERRLNRRRFANPQEQAAFIIAEALKNNKHAKLERVLGCTASSSSFCHDPTTGIVGYAAGSTVVILGKHNSQSHLVNNSKNNITCLAFSPDGKYLATGEFGADPMVRVWELPREGPFHAKQLVELKGHTFGINCVRFTHDSRQVISIGNQHDRAVVVWHWKEQRKSAENRLTSQVNAMDIFCDGDNFVTVGVRHVKFWMLGESDRALNGRSAILAEQRTNTFLAVCCAPGSRTFAITNTRILVEFRDKKIVNTFEMKGDVPQSIALGPSNYLLVGFSNGLIRAIHTETFDVTHLHGKPHYHYHDIADATDFSNFYKNIAQNGAVANFPDVRAITFFKKTNVLTVLYSDRSIYQWSLTDDFRQSLIHGYRNHVGAIMDLEMVPMNYPWLSAGTFITVGIDGTIRFWYLEKQQEVSDSVLSSNVLSPELKKILYLGDDEKLFKDVCDTNQGMFNDSLDCSSGAKCVRLKPDGTHLAAGFRDGNLGIFDLTSTEFKKLSWIEAHDGEILCAEYTDPRVYNSHCILATGGRDRLIHLFDADNGYSHIQSVEDHSSSVNSIKFIPFYGGFEMFTCGTDKLVVIRKLIINDDISLERTNQFNSSSGLNYLTTTPENSLIFACQDRQLRTYSNKGKLIKQIKGTLCEEGTLTKLALDPSGTFAATVCSDRYVYLIDIATGECAAVLNGQADCVTAIAFTPDCRRLLVVSHSGCVFVWRLSNMLTKKMTTKLGRPEQVERCTTPDSVIESGSDSASVNGKKDRSGLTGSGSEFGSLTSLPIINDDDLDSGVGGARHPVIDLDAKDSNHFEIRRLPQEVVRRSSSSYLNAPETDLDRSSPLPNSEMSQMLSHPQPNAYVSSQSMSNLHRSNASPQRIRRKWNDLNPTASPSPVNSPDYSNSPTQQGHVYQQPIQSLKTSGIGTSISLHGLRNYNHYESPVATSTPKNTFAPVPLRHSNQNYDYRPGQFENSFDRSNSSRNSLTKKFMNLGTSSTESKAVWTPPKYDTNRRPSGLFNGNLNGGNAIQRRQSEKPIPVSVNMSTDDGSRRLFQSRMSSNPLESPDSPQSPSISVQLRTKKVDRKTRSRITMSDCYDLRSNPGILSPLSPGLGLKSLQEEDYESSDLHLRSTSQSPSTLMLNLEREQSRSRPSLRHPSDVGSRITPSGSRSNLRSVSTTLNKSSQALNKMLEAREKLKKSQENLSIQIGEEPTSILSANSMSRSRSIGNLRFSAAKINDNLGYGEFNDGLNDKKRQMARSVTSLHNGGIDDEMFQHPDDVTLQNQYAGGSRRQSTSRLADSIKNLRKLSNPDLTNEQLYEPDTSQQHGFMNESTSSSTNAAPLDAYYTLPKNLRNTKGPVSKRVHKVTAVRVDQTSESDSNASDQTPNNGFNYLKSSGSGFLRSNGPSRSSSSIEPGRVAASRRAFEPIPMRKPANYLAQKISQQERMDLGGPEVDESSPRSTTSSEIPMSDELSKKMAMHLYECIEQFNTACDKILGARQLIDTDSALNPSDREKLLRLVNKSIIQGKSRLEGIDSSRTISSGTGGSMASTNSKLRSSSPNHESKIQIDNNFMKMYGQQIMQLLQQNMAKQN